MVAYGNNSLHWQQITSTPWSVLYCFTWAWAWETGYRRGKLGKAQSVNELSVELYVMAYWLTPCYNFIQIWNNCFIFVFYILHNIFLYFIFIFHKSLNIYNSFVCCVLCSKFCIHSTSVCAKVSRTRPHFVYYMEITL